MEIKKLGATVHGNGNFIIYGASGNGKTFSLQTLPESETLIVNFDNGLRTLKDSFKNVDVADIDTMPDMVQLYTKHLAGGKGKWKYIAIDSLSALSELALENAKTKSKDGRKHYGLMADTVSKIIKLFNDLPQTIIYIAEEERVNNEMAAEMEYVIAPAIPGKKFASKLPYKFDYVFVARSHRDEDGNIHRRFQTSLDGTGVYLAKARLSRIGQLELFENPNWGEIFKKLE